MIVVLEWLKQKVFARKLVDDDREIKGNPLFRLELPTALLMKGGDDVQRQTKTICALFPPDFGFYYQLVVIVFVQGLFNAILGAFVYKIVIEPQRQEKKRSDALQNGKGVGVNYTIEKSQDSQSISSGTTASLFAFGIAMPFVVLEPIYAIRVLDIRNAGLVMLFLATPIVNSLRITEALYGFAPAPAKSSLRNYLLYFSCLFGMEFDSSTGGGRRVSRDFFRKRLATLCRDFLIVSLVISILEPRGYEFFDTHTAVDSMDHTLSEMISWKHLLNNFLVAVLLSASLSQSSIGISLIYNILYGVQTYEIVLNPMLKSKSPSDFWGRRWNVLVHRGLKSGVYKPTRRRTSSRLMAVAATFVVSGIIHEYVNYVMFAGKGESLHTTTTTSYRFTWKQMLFFGWNGVLILLEYCIGHWGIFRWISLNLPQIVTTGLVLCCALPLAHLFIGDWIKHGYFHAVYLAEPVVVCHLQSNMAQ